MARLRGGAGRFRPVGGDDRRLRRRAPRAPGDHRAHREARPRSRPAVRRGDVRPAPGRGRAPGLASGRAHRAGPQGRADRAARRRRALRGAVHAGVLAAEPRGVRARRAGRGAARRGGRRGGQLPLRAQGGRRPGAAGAARAARSASPSRTRRWSPSDGLVFSSTYIRSCVDAGDVARRRGRARPAAPSGRRGGPRRSARQGAGLPDRQPDVPPLRGDPRRRRLRGLVDRGGVPGPLPASVSIGTNPTFSGPERRVEAYVLDFDGDLYGERVELDFVGPPA